MALDEQTQKIYDILNTHDPYKCFDRPCKAVSEIKALIAQQVKEARIKEAEYYLRNAAELSLKRTVGVNVIKDRIAALKGDNK